MIDDIDIARAAGFLMDRHGDEAPVHAARKANELFAQGNLAGCALWRRIRKAIEELDGKVQATIH